VTIKVILKNNFVFYIKKNNFLIFHIIDLLILQSRNPLLIYFIQILNKLISKSNIYKIMMFKSKLKNAKWILSCLVFMTMGALQAQTYKIVPKISTIKIAGTSSVHEWESTTDQINGDLVLGSDGKTGKQIQSLVVKVPVKSIKSGKGLMDSKTYDAFESDKNPLITFQVTDVSPIKLTGKDVETMVTGNLNMAGLSKKISFKSTGKLVTDGTYQFKGSVLVKMSDFKMKPPTAMMGMLKTGDAVTINFDVTFKSI